MAQIGYTPPAMRHLALLGLVLVARAAHAGALEPLGFTPDGQVVAVLEKGTHDGSGFPFAKITFLDTKTGRAKAKTDEVTLEEEGATEALALEKVKAKAETTRAALKLDPLVPGKAIAMDAKGELSEKAGPPIGRLEVAAKKASKKQAAQACDEPFRALLLTVKLFWMDDETPAVLLRDSKVPKERACVTGCAPESVFAHKKSALVVLKCEAPGFEGPDARRVPIAAQLKYGLDEELPGSTPGQ